MGTIASQITSLTIVYSAVYSGADQRKHQSSASLAFVRGISRGPVNSPHKWPVTRKMFPFDDVIMNSRWMVISKQGWTLYVYNILMEVSWWVKHNVANPLRKIIGECVVSSLQATIFNFTHTHTHTIYYHIYTYTYLYIYIYIYISLSIYIYMSVDHFIRCHIRRLFAPWAPGRTETDCDKDKDN